MHFNMHNHNYHMASMHNNYSGAIHIHNHHFIHNHDLTK